MKMKVLEFICMCILFLDSVAYGSYKYGPYTTSSVSKTTPIPAKTPQSPVIKDQTTVPVLYSLSTRLLAGFARFTYPVLANQPVYRERYFQYGTEITIPKERAIRVHFEEKTIAGPNGTRCLFTKPELVPNYEKLNPSILTSMMYVDNNKVTKGMMYHYRYSENKTIDRLNNAKLDEPVHMWTWISFNGTVIANTTCDRVTYAMNGTLVRLFETNPDADTTPNAGVTCMSNLWMTILSVVLLYFAGKLA